MSYARPLQERLLQAHAENDQHALVSLYTEAADLMQLANTIDAACFYLTQAFVHALEIDAPSLESLHARLAQHGRVHAL